MPFTKIDKPSKPPAIAITGPSGAGKTHLALALATEWVVNSGKRIAFLDTESGRGKYFARVFDYDYDQLRGTFDPALYIKAIKEASEAKDENGGQLYEAIILDSMTHAWNDTGGILDKVNSAGGNSYQQWGKIGTPEFKKLMGAIIRSPIAVFCTMRSKMDYVQELNDKGKMAPVRVGLMPEMRESATYDFDFWLELNMDHTFRVTKCPPIPDMTNSVVQPGAIAAFAQTVKAWMEEGSLEEFVPQTWDDIKYILNGDDTKLNQARDIYKRNPKLMVQEVWQELHREAQPV